MICSAPLRETCTELVPIFEQSSGHPVTTIWAATGEIMNRVEAGEAVDIVIMNAPSIDRLIRQGKLAADSRVDIAKSGIGVAVATGAAKIDIRSVEGIRSSVLAAKSIAISSGMSGMHVRRLFESWGLLDQLQQKIKELPPGMPVGEVVARGNAQIGFQQVSELLPIKGIDYLGPLPTQLQHLTVFSAALHTGAHTPGGAKALLDFLTSRGAIPVIRKWGMEPGWLS
jgi:molybdate transport system substrate-binding protein